MCRNLSFIFKNRPIAPSSPEFTTHVKLCYLVLEIFSKSARDPPNGVERTPWNEYLCRIFLGICEEVMKVWCLIFSCIVTKVKKKGGLF